MTCYCHVLDAILFYIPLLLKEQRKHPLFLISMKQWIYGNEREPDCMEMKEYYFEKEAY